MNQLTLNNTEIEIIDFPEPKEIILPVRRYDGKEKALKIKDGTRLVTGEQIIPGLVSTVTGTVAGVEGLAFPDGDYTVLRIEVEGKDELSEHVKSEPEYLKKDPAKLLRLLNQANLKLSSKLSDIKTVIVSAVDPDPPAVIQQQLFRENEELIREGLELIKHITGAERVVLAVSGEQSDLAKKVAGGIAEIKLIKSKYPHSLPEIIANDIVDSDHSDQIGFLSIEKLLSAVLALKEGLPAVYKTVSIISKNGVVNYKVRIGTLLKELLKDIPIADNAKIILGSPLRGDSCYTTDIPVTGDVDMIYVQDSSEVYRFQNQQCINCGSCVEVCPLDLPVNLIGRYAEFSIFDKCRDLDIESCLECGLCAYHCPAGRSLIQLIRLAKKELTTQNLMTAE